MPRIGRPHGRAQHDAVHGAVGSRSAVHQDGSRLRPCRRLLAYAHAASEAAILRQRGHIQRARLFPMMAVVVGVEGDGAAYGTDARRRHLHLRAAVLEPDSALAQRAHTEGDAVDRPRRQCGADSDGEVARLIPLRHARRAGAHADADADADHQRATLVPRRAIGAEGDARVRVARDPVGRHVDLGGGLLVPRCRFAFEGHAHGARRDAQGGALHPRPAVDEHGIGRTKRLARGAVAGRGGRVAYRHWPVLVPRGVGRYGDA